LLHGLEDLPPAERAHYERAEMFRPAGQVTRQINRYVPVAATDELGRAFRESVAREIELNPAAADLLRKVERNAERYHQHYQSSQRLGVPRGT
jgi:hypothetical protein